jgi:hypothetical protein
LNNENERGGLYLGVDGVKIFVPKLPVHIRIHKESFERKEQRVGRRSEMS